MTVGTTYSGSLEGVPEFTEAKTKEPELKPVPEIVKPSKRRLVQPKFVMPFETIDDMRLRLEGTIIFVGSEPYRVQRCRMRRGEMVLDVMDDQEATYLLEYGKCAHVDLRTPEPGYIQYGDKPMYLSRSPRRQQRQGLDTANCFLKTVGTDYHSRIDNYLYVMRGLKNSEPLVFNDTFLSLMTKNCVLGKLRLSGNVALYTNDAAELSAEYKGRYLGRMKENAVFVDEDDYEKPWIKREVGLVGLEVRKETERAS